MIMVSMDGYSIGGQARHDANATASREWEEKLVGKRLGTKHDNDVSILRLCLTACLRDGKDVRQEGAAEMAAR